MQKRKIVLVAISLFIVAAALFYWFLNHQTTTINLWPKNVLHFQGSESALGLPVSISALDENQYFIADYANLFLLDARTGNLNLIKPEINQPYYPTGVYYYKIKNLLYVANYLANNILVFEFSPDQKTIKLKQTISSPNTVSPENVYVSDDGQYLAVACYDGNSVTLFDIKDSPKELWHTNISLAHGVSILNNKIYATSLSSKRIYELDILTGDTLRKVGQQGWNAMNQEFLWPTQIYPFDKNTLIISDAHTGYISLFDINSFKIKSYFGGNGPTFHNLNMPYSAIFDGSNFIIVSTFQQRLIFGDKNFKFTKTIATGADWDYAKKEKMNAQFYGPPEWNNQYIKVKGQELVVNDKSYLLGYGWLFTKDKLALGFQLPSSPSIFGGYAYFTDVAVFQDGYFIISPQSSVAFFLVKEKNYLFPLQISSDSWISGNYLFSPKQKQAATVFQDKAHQKTKILEDLRRSKIVLDNQDICDLLTNEILSGSDCDQKLSQSFTSGPKIKEFFVKYQTLQKQSKVTQEDLTNLKNLYEKKTNNLGEFSLINMLTRPLD